MEVVIMNMSGAYEQQTFYKQIEHSWIECKDVQGTNCYLEDAAKENLRQRISECSAEGIHFMDSGNYHHLSLLWMEKVKTKFNLIHFDNHPDMQVPAFGGITSCGGWLREAIETNPNIQEVYIVGVDEMLVEEERPIPVSVHIGLPWEINGAEKDLSVTEKINNVEEINISMEMPVYISLDKDLLTTEYAICDWSQGNTKLDKLKKDLIYIFRNYNVIGIDICGEAKDIYDSHAIEINNRTNRILLELWQDVLCHTVYVVSSEVVTTE